MSRKDFVSEEPALHHIHSAISATLAVGMYATVSLYVVGVILSFVKLKHVPSLAHQYFGSVGGFLKGLVALDPRPFLLLGTVTLIFTPAACILISVFTFWRRRDFKYVGVTTAVLLVIVISVVVGSIFKVKVG